MKNKIKSKLPIAIIGLIIFAAVVFSACSGSSTVTNTTPTPTKTVDFSKLPPGASPAWTKGSPTALVTVEEFADFQCPTCGVMHPKVNELRNAFGDRVKIIFRQFPLTQVHPHAYDAACAAEAAGIQGKFWEMQNLLFTNQRAWANATDARPTFIEYAKTLGLDADKFSDDMIGLAVKNRVDADMKRGQAIPVGSTPSFFINNKPLGNNLDGLKAAVEKALQEAEGAKQPAPEAANTSNTNSSNK